MSRADGDRNLADRQLETAVDDVVAAEDVARETARATLSRVAEDGVITIDAFEAALSETAKVLSTAETRTELAVSALDDARAAAEPVANLAVVQTRLDDLAAEVDAATADLETVQAALGAITGRDTGVTYTAVREMRDVYEDASSVQGRADEVQVALAEFETWVTDEDERAAGVHADVDDLAAAVDALEDSVEDVMVDGDAAAWADTAIQRASLALFVRDLRAELDTLRSWPVATDGDPDWDAVAERIDALDERVTDMASSLERAGQPAWRDRHGASVDAVEQALSDWQPPVDWAAVQSELDDLRPADRTT
ncbi:hypothetical protein [Haloarcula sebkhae]|nr:hypothetical protein [Haloarcula sebkhae]